MCVYARLYLFSSGQRLVEIPYMKWNVFIIRPTHLFDYLNKAQTKKNAAIKLSEYSDYYYYYYYYYLLQLGFHPVVVVLTLVHTIQMFSPGGSSPYTSTHNTNVFTRWQQSLH
jgi:hypothetical protein